MSKRFVVNEIHICPFERIRPGILKPNIKDYPTRVCVIDEEKQIAVDIKTGLKYDYVPTISNLYFLSQSYEKIHDDKRVAVFPLLLLGNDSFNLLNEAEDIKQKLANDYEFKDGNEVYGNEQYLEYIKQEKEIEAEVQESGKTKKLGKRKK